MRKYCCNLCSTLQPPIVRDEGVQMCALLLGAPGGTLYFEMLPGRPVQSSLPPPGDGPYQVAAGSQQPSADSQLLICVKLRPRVVHHVQSRRLRVILLDCLDSFHGKLDEGEWQAPRLRRSGDVTEGLGGSAKALKDNSVKSCQRTQRKKD